jgi:hypothetical protein
LWSKARPRQKARSYLKNNLKAKRAQVVECLPNKCKALSLNPVPPKKKKKKERKKERKKKKKKKSFSAIELI